MAVLNTALDWGLAMRALRPIRVFWILRNHRISNDLWNRVTAGQRMLQSMTAAEKMRLRTLATLFLNEKKFFGVRGLPLDDDKRLAIAVQACIPALGLGFDCLSGWRDVVVFPDAIGDIDENGYSASQHKSLLTERKWRDSPLLVSWAALERDVSHPRYGRSSVIHAIASKIERLDGYADGLVPLRQLVDFKQWSASLAAVYQRFIRQGESQLFQEAAGSTDEIFAVISEYFFCAPHLLEKHLPDVFRQFQLFYRRYPPTSSRPT